MAERRGLMEITSDARVRLMVQTSLATGGSWFLSLFVWFAGSQCACLGQVLEAHIKWMDD